jgi:hypothetical protein
MYFPIEIQEIRRTNRVYHLSVKCFTTVREIKLMLQKVIAFPLNRMQLFHSSRSEALGNQTTLHELAIDREGFSLTLSLTVNCNPHYLLEPLKLGHLDARCNEMVQRVKEGLISGQSPTKTDLLDCTGGVYFLKERNNGNSIAVFKPHDEEQGMPNNPKGYAGNGKTGLREQFTPGEGYLREVAAYILDDKNFAGVPATCLAHCEHPVFHYSNQRSSRTSLYPKLGSLQEFIKASDTFEDISYSLMGTLELQKIALFDMRVLNCDRNSANILCDRKPLHEIQLGRPRRDSRSGSMTSDNEFEEMDMSEWMERPLKKNSRGNDDCYELFPIDHGYCLPPKLLIEEFDWCWFNCPQISQPVEPEIKKYMNELDIDRLIERVKSQLRAANQSLSEDCFFLLRLAHNLILQGINQGLSLRDIAGLIARTEDGIPSALEKAVTAAEENAQRAVAAHGRGGNGFLSIGSSSALPQTPPRRMKSPSCVTSIVHTVLPTSGTTAIHLPNNTLRTNGGSAPRLTHPSSLASSHHLLLLRSPMLLSPVSLTREGSSYSAGGGPETCPSSVATSIGDSSYLRQRGPLTYLSSLEPSPTGSRENLTCNSGNNSNSNNNNQMNFSHGSLSHSNNNSNHGSFFLRNLSPSAASEQNEFTESSSDSSAELLVQSIVGVKGLPGKDETGFCSSNDENEMTMISMPVDIEQQQEEDNKISTAVLSVEQQSNNNNNNNSTETGGFVRRVSSFSALEVQTTEPMVFEKNNNSSNSGTHHHSSGCTSEEEEEDGPGGVDAVSPVSELLSLSQHSATSSGTNYTGVSGGMGLTRVVSFNAFESPALYENERNDRFFHRLKREKRKLSVKSPEFQELRMNFAREAIVKTIATHFKAK